MATARRRSAAGQLRTLYHLGAIGDLSDRQLLERFTAGEPELAELAFAALIERHGPLVDRVCSALLRNPHDAQDAFQATFLVLVRKARGLWIRDSLGPWLHRVAKRLAVQAQASARRRRTFERRAADSGSASNPEPRERNGEWTVLHEEIDRLPERYRVPVILCHLEGQRQELAARALGLPVGTLKSRLHRARAILRSRLSRRGVTLSATLLTAEFSRTAASAVTLPLSQSWIRAAAQSGAQRAGDGGLISLRTVHLVEEAIKTMFFTRMKSGVALILLAACLAAGAAAVFAQQDPEQGAAATASGPAAEAATPSGGNRAPAPSYIRQSRKMIVERLEQELAVARERLDRTTRKVRASSDPEVVRARKTVDTLTSLLARIDAVLVEAVDEFPTAFDFTSALAIAATGPTDASSITSARPAPERVRAQKSPTDPSAVPPYDEHSLANAAEKLEWSRKMHEKGYVTKKQFDQELASYQALGARIDADIARAAERVDWAKRMFEKGYVTRSQYDAEILKHYDALMARVGSESQAVNDELLDRYERLKKKLLERPVDQDATGKPNGSSSSEKSPAGAQ